MGTKTISLTEEAYERLKAHRKTQGDSFSRVVMRAFWDDEPLTAGELLSKWRNRAPFFSEEQLSAIECAKAGGSPPEDKWNRR